MNEFYFFVAPRAFVHVIAENKQLATDAFLFLHPKGFIEIATKDQMQVNRGLMLETVIQREFQHLFNNLKSN